jgi:hypothetical protein
MVEVYQRGACLVFLLPRRNALGTRIAQVYAHALNGCLYRVIRLFAA